MAAATNHKGIEMGYCTNPACSRALRGSYIAWLLRRGRDLRALLKPEVHPKIAKSILCEAAHNDVAVEVISADRAILATWESDDEWSLWEIRMHQSFDDEDDGYAFGQASDAAYLARGKEPPSWTVITFPVE
jgi:hypothetical protein